MKKLTLCAVAVLGIALVGCTSRDESKLDTLEPWGSDFNRSLAQEYRHYTINDPYGQWGFMDGNREFFVVKGRHSLQGRQLNPESLEDWDVPSEYAGELQAGRDQLMAAYKMDARALAPELSARAQARFDCWLEAASAGGESTAMQSCRDEFFGAMSELERVISSRRQPMAPPPQPRDLVETAAPVTPVMPTPPVQATEEVPEYIIYFAFDSAEIDQKGLGQLGELLEDVQVADVVNIRLVGHTDTSGTNMYNQKLSERRGKAVKSVLLNNGVDASKISVLGMGEAETAVPTGDGVKERLNRRVEIFIMNPEMQAGTMGMQDGMMMPEGNMGHSMQ